MNTNNPNSHPESWDRFWQGTGDAGAFSSGGVSHPVIEAFWGEFLYSAKEHYAAPHILDVAAGNGAIVEAALEAFGDNVPTISCIDISGAAIANLEKRFPSVTGIVSDAKSMPFDDRSFDIVTSQFGVEYAGADAVFEAARLVNPGGRLALLIHIDGGRVHKECRDSLAAIEAIRQSDFVGLAMELFRNGFAAVRGADRAPYDAAGSRFAPAVAAAETIMEEHGHDVAGGTIARLYDDVARIHTRLPNYDPDEILAWLGGMDSELVAYGERMSSMTSTAMSQAAFDVVCERLRSEGFKLEIAHDLRSAGEPLSLAWALIALRVES